MTKQIMWVVYGAGPGRGIQLNTLSYLRKDAIAKHLKGTSYTWGDVKKFGWWVSKVEVTIKTIYGADKRVYPD